MSEEKLDKIDRRLTELVNVTGNLVTTVRELVGKVDDNSKRISSLEEHQKEMSKQISAVTKQQEATSKQISAVTEQQKVTSAQLADVVRVVIKTDQRVEKMSQRMEQGFEELHNESRIANRKIDWAANTSLDAQKRVEDLESRVSKIEEKVL